MAKSSSMSQPQYPDPLRGNRDHRSDLRHREFPRDGTSINRTCPQCGSQRCTAYFRRDGDAEIYQSSCPDCRSRTFESQYPGTTQRMDRPTQRMDRPTARNESSDDESSDDESSDDSLSDFDANIAEEFHNLNIFDHRYGGRFEFGIRPPHLRPSGLQNPTHGLNRHLRRGADQGRGYHTSRDSYQQRESDQRREPRVLRPRNERRWRPAWYHTQTERERNEQPDLTRRWTYGPASGRWSINWEVEDIGAAEELDNQRRNP